MRIALSTLQRSFDTFSARRFRVGPVCYFTTDILKDKEKTEENVYISRLEKENREKMRIEREKHLREEEKSDAATKKTQDKEKK